MFRNRTLLCKQDQPTGQYIYLCVEIVSKRKLKQHAKLISEDKMNFYVNARNDLIFSQQRGHKRAFEITSFDKKTGEIKDMLRSFTHTMPLTFLSPSFYCYIQVEHHTHRIRVRETFTDHILCTIP